jgi:hypothetical protein
MGVWKGVEEAEQLKDKRHGAETQSAEDDIDKTFQHN